jgi:hypothetical protein
LSVAACAANVAAVQSSEAAIDLMCDVFIIVFLFIVFPQSNATVVQL